jgi:hypothetical protein
VASVRHVSRPLPVSFPYRTHPAAHPLQSTVGLMTRRENGVERGASGSVEPGEKLAAVPVSGLRSVANVFPGSSQAIPADSGMAS